MTMFKIDDSDIKQLESDIKTFAARSLPFATKNTLNKAAFTGQKIAREGIKREMITRNRFTVQSVRVEQTRTLRISNQSATLGSIAPFMETQEFGGTETAIGKHGIDIPTSYSAGQEGAKPRTRLPRKANSLAQIRLGKKGGRRAKNSKQAFLFKVQDAVTSGKRNIFHKFTNGNAGIFRVVGGKKKFKRGWPDGANLKMVHNLSFKSVTIHKNPWLKPAVDETVRLIPGIYRESLIFQLRKHGLFK